MFKLKMPNYGRLENSNVEWVRQVLFPDFLRQFFQFNLFKSFFEWGVDPP